ncbi:VOC family protein [Pelagibacterium sp. 26DY04]|uniref:VOC family protein n=1 Tax=Pelagibacterium sp. 26DY04 TaxID=2967130 RepID=UPI0028162254|nr:VOC family protein [Pelagibacterium sp. 26DY04]WMT87137.1 VOC family protein [Pelagibacterium sp. 26DY04]
MKVVANIDFDGDCREAFTTYAKILGGEIRAMISNRDMPEMAEGVPEDRLDRIVHAWIDIGDQALMGQDMRDFSGRKGYSVTVSADSVDQARAIFNALSEGGDVLMAFEPQSWSQGFGMTMDRFGVAWVIDSPAAG